MKFNNGYWLMRAGMEPHFAVEYAGHECRADTLLVYAATRRVTGRGDTLNHALLTVAFSVPVENTVRAELIHHAGAGDECPTVLNRGSAPPRGPEAYTFTTETADALYVRCGDNLTVVVDKRPGQWSIRFEDGASRTYTESADKGMAFIHDANTRRGYMVVELSLNVGETVYGLGERFTPFVKNGQAVTMWNEDGGTSSDIAYKNIPFYLSSRGYGVLVDSTADVEFEVGSEKVSRVQFSLSRQSMAFVVMAGPSPRAVVERLTTLTGRPAMPPAWSFGLWLTTSFTTDYDETTVASFLDGMRERQIPLHVFHFDCFWMRAYHWCDFQWDPRAFPDPAGILARLKERGLRVCVWINPYIAQRSALFAEAAEQGYLLKRKNGSVWQTDLWQPGMGVVDFTNPAASAWFAGKLEALLDAGVDCFKTDFGERIPAEDVTWYDGSDPVCMHNDYAYRYNRVVYLLLERRRGPGDVCLFARSAAPGAQRFPVHWGGDCAASYVSMAETLRGGLSLALCGFGFWSHDVGGFEQTASPDLYKRWCAFGLLSSHSRLHGSASYRVPWLFDEEACDVLRRFVSLKCELMPYLYGQAVLAHETGAPLLRPMVFDFPQDPACRTLDTQYMLGDALLVAPVFSADGRVQYYLPEGRWTHFLSGVVREGGRYYEETHDYFSLPLYVRPGSILVTGSRADRPDYAYAEGMTVGLYETTPGESVVCVPDEHGNLAARVVVTLTDSGVEVIASPAPRAWRVFLPSADRLPQTRGGKACPGENGRGVFVDCEGPSVVIYCRPSKRGGNLERTSASACEIR